MDRTQGELNVRISCWLAALAAALFLTGAVAQADDKKPAGEASFGALKGTDTAEARKQAEAWLKTTGKADAARVSAIWQADRPLIDKVAATLELGSPAAAALLKEARDEDAAAPTQVPRLLKDSKQSAFFRATL